MAEEIVEEIISLRGEKLGDIFKNFQLLLNNKNEIIKENIQGILEVFTPNNYLQQLCKLKLIDAFKQYDEVENILKSDNMFHIGYALKCSWFFTKIKGQDATDSSSIFVNEFIPSVSYCTRMKVLKLYSRHLKNASIAQNLFTMLHKKYHLDIAFILLPACGEKFIRDELPSFKVQLPLRVLNAIFNLYPDLITEYIECILDGISGDKRAFCSFRLHLYEPFFSKLASSSTKVFMKLFEKYHSYIPSICFGRRITKRIMKCDMNTFIQNFKIYNQIFKLKIVTDSMSLLELEKLQLTLFPNSINLFFKKNKRELFMAVVSHLEREVRAKILMNNFNKVFGKTLTFEEFSSVLTLSLVQDLSLDIRTKWIASNLIKLENTYDQADNISYLPISISIPQLKKLMENQSDVHMRVCALKSMFQSIKFNKDVDSIPEVISYLSKRFRNDNALIRQQLFDELIDSKSLVVSMKIEDWDCVDELMKIVKLNKEQSDFEHGIKSLYKLQILNYFKKGLPMDTHLQNYIEVMTKLFGNCDFDLKLDSQYEKTCLEYFIKHFQSINWDKEKKNVEHQLSLFYAITKFNQNNRKEKIEAPEWMVETLLSNLMDKSEGWRKKKIVDSLKYNPSIKERVFRNIFLSYIDPSIFVFILKRTPLDIVNNISVVMEKLLEQLFSTEHKIFFKRAKMYSSFDLPQKICDICLEFLSRTPEPEDKYSIKPNAVRTLSILLPADQFVNAMAEYYPTSGVIDYSDENDFVYRIQQEIAVCLKDLNNSNHALGPLKKFATGDYLKYVVGSINSISLKVSEKNIIPQLRDWMDSPVSVRKHIIRCFYKIATKSEVAQLIQALYPNEKNSSMRLLLFDHTFKFFTNEPCEETFNVLKFVVHELKSQDSLAINEMFALHSIPNEFVSKFIEMLWELVSLKEDKLGNHNKNGVIQLIDKEILQLLNEDFCELLLSHIFSMENLQNIHLFDFVAHYLLYSSDKDVQSSRLDKTMIYFKNMVEGHWDNYNLNSFIVFPVRKVVHHFVKHLCEESRDRKKLLLDPSSVLKELRTRLKSIIQDESILEELLIIDFTIVYHKCFVSIGQDTPQLFADFVKSSLETYKSINDSVIISIIQKAVPFHMLKAEETLTLAEILLSERSPLCNILGIHITNNKVNEEFSVNSYRKILNLIFENENPSVMVYSNSLLKSLVSTVKIS